MPPRINGGETVKLRPMIFARIRNTLIAIRFGREGYRAFSERNQGTRGIPTQWWYMFGGRVAFHKRAFNA